MHQLLLASSLSVRMVGAGAIPTTWLYAYPATRQPISQHIPAACVAVCYNVLQYVAVCCSVLQLTLLYAHQDTSQQIPAACAAVCYSVVQCVAVCCSWCGWMHTQIQISPLFLQVVVAHVRCSVVQCVAVCCSVLQLIWLYAYPATKQPIISAGCCGACVLVCKRIWMKDSDPATPSNILQTDCNTEQHCGGV